jgi:hypothetical protein
LPLNLYCNKVFRPNSRSAGEHIGNSFAGVAVSIGIVPASHLLVGVGVIQVIAPHL